MIPFLLVALLLFSGTGFAFVLTSESSKSSKLGFSLLFAACLILGGIGADLIGRGNIQQRLADRLRERGVDVIGRISRYEYVESHARGGFHGYCPVVFYVAPDGVERSILVRRATTPEERRAWPASTTPVKVTYLQEDPDVARVPGWQDYGTEPLRESGYLCLILDAEMLLTLAWFAFRRTAGEPPGLQKLREGAQDESRREP
jgi:hypothetical protein